ncbi:hypothetical protein V2K00_11570 [Pseudomonas alliivorans]|nr:hypothetical protein [Pseudomonas alliivorans]MEE5094960.1 hypothetical protein [Pseudomonas alliivorans]
MNFSLVENPQLAIVLLIAFVVVVSVTLRFVWKRKVSVKAKNGAVAVNGPNKGTINTSYRKGK